MVKKSITRSSTDDAGGSSSKSWWRNMMSETDELDDIRFGNKMVLLMDILKECAMIGDKVGAVDTFLSSFNPTVSRCWCSASLCCPWTSLRSSWLVSTRLTSPPPRTAQCLSIWTRGCRAKTITGWTAPLPQTPGRCGVNISTRPPATG